MSQGVGIRHCAEVDAVCPRKEYRSSRSKPEVIVPNYHLHTYALSKDSTRPQDGIGLLPHDPGS